MSREELALKLLQNELGDRPPTPENVMEASIFAVEFTAFYGGKLRGD